MTLTLRAVSLNDQPLTQPITAHFDSQGGTIGRADHNTMALPDPERHISRQQAQISAVSNGYSIKNVGSANPIIVRGQTLAQGESALLFNRDQVRIGGYLLEVTQEHAAEATTITRGRAHVDAMTPAARSAPGSAARASRSGNTTPGALGDLASPLSSDNPFADLIGTSPPAPSVKASAASDDPFADLIPGAAGVAPSSKAWSAPPPPTARQLPDDFDPFAPPRAAPAVSSSPTTAPPSGVFGDLIPGAAPSSIDEMFGLKGHDARDPLDDFLAGTSALPANAASTGSADPFAMFNDPPPAPSPTAPATPDHTPELRAAFVPPAVSDGRIPTAFDLLAAPNAAPLPAPKPAPRAGFADTPSPKAVSAPVRDDPPAPAATPVAVPAEPSSACEADAARLWAAFCEGAGVRLPLPQGLNPELMKVIGSVLRSAVDGTLKLVAVRAATKHELRAQVTMIQARNNNPLKFSPDGQVALEQMLQPPVRGFLPGPVAMGETMDDLVGHSIGTMAGTRAALDGVLDRFAPAELEAKLSAKSVLDSVLPINRKAKLWDLYLQHFETIRNEAQDDFQNLFGKAFVAAYEQQLERLKREKNKGA